MTRPSDTLKESIKFATGVMIVYVLPGIVCMINAVQTKNNVLAAMSFFPLVNIVGSFISLGEIVFRLFT